MQSAPPIPAALLPLGTAEIELSRVHSETVSLHPETEERGLTEAITYPTLSRWRTITIISTVTGITVLNSMQSGIVTVGLPTIGRDLGLNQSLILWSLTPVEVSLKTGQARCILWRVAVFSCSRGKWPMYSVRVKSSSRDVFSTHLLPLPLVSLPHLSNSSFFVPYKASPSPHVFPPPSESSLFPFPRVQRGILGSRFWGLDNRWGLRVGWCLVGCLFPN